MESVREAHLGQFLFNLRLGEKAAMPENLPALLVKEYLDRYIFDSETGGQNLLLVHMDEKHV
jgi:hypothetical protein